MDETNHNDVAEIAKLAAKAARASTIATVDGREYLIVPDGLKHIEVTDPHGLSKGAPARVKQSVTIQTEASLGDYVKRFGGESTILFADVAANTIVAAIDYHGEAKGAVARPDNLDHRATLVLPFSEEWKDWGKVDGQLMDQLSFARFIEENAADIAAPTGAELLETCRDLAAVRQVNFIKAVRTASDNESFEYSDDTQLKSKAPGGKAVEVPKDFLLRIPVYFGGRSTELVANLRWKLEDGSLKLGVKLRRAEHVRQAMFKEIVGDLVSVTDCPAVFGRP